MDIPYHSYANIFPLIEGDDFDDLVEDIRENGLHEKIILLDGQILDGRNRYRALGRLRETRAVRGKGWGAYSGQPIIAEDLDPKAGVGLFEAYLSDLQGPALDFVISRNLRRRHLTTSQRAMVAADLGRLGWGGQRSKGSNEPLSTDQRAKMLNVGRATVTRAQAVVDKGEPELQESVRRGETSVDTAAGIARLPRERQREILGELAQDPEGRRAIKSIAKQARAEDRASRHEERQRKLEDIATKNPELPSGRLYSFVLIDVPRHHNVYSDDTGSEKAPENHYPTLSFRQLCDFAIDRFAAKDAIIAYWSTAASLLDDLDILAEWGFVSLRPRGGDGRLLRDDEGEPLSPIGGGRYGSHLIWRKIRVGNQTGTGRWVFDDHELLILARRGDVPAPIPGTQPRSVLEADATEHSAKPNAELRGMIDRQWPHLSKIEVFARGAPPPGWTFWGNQVEEPEIPEHDHETGEIVDADPEPEPEPAPQPKPSPRAPAASDAELEIPAFLRRQPAEPAE